MSKKKKDKKVRKGKKRNHREMSNSNQQKKPSKDDDSRNDPSKSSNTSNNTDVDVANKINETIMERYPATEQPISHRKTTLSKFSSWNQAFQAAASITPHDLGEDYVDPSLSSPPDVPFGSGDVLAISQIAKQCMSKKDKRDKEMERNVDDPNDDRIEKIDVIDKKISSKKKESKKAKKSKKKQSKSSHRHSDHKNQRDDEENGEQDDQQPQVEGQMITHHNQSIMVLVDKANKLVYSSTQRNDDGTMIVIGTVGPKHDDIQITNERLTSNEHDKDSSLSSPLNDIDFPFEADPDDHCETPLEAYEDIYPILQGLQQIQAGSTNCMTKDDFAIYDPYYCNGSVIRHLNTLGYTNVYNKKEDCYNTWSSSSSKHVPYPNYDVFITNPPYSNDHIEKLISHLTTDERTLGKPWCLLMPSFVHKKDFYKDKVASKKGKSNEVKGGRLIEPFYLVPKKRYIYIPPKNFRQKKSSDVHKKSSPFVSIWYVYGGTKEKTDKLVQAYKKWQKVQNCDKCELARSKSALRDLRRKKK